MKKNILSLIGAICGFLSILFILSPFAKAIYNNETIKLIKFYEVFELTSSEALSLGSLTLILIFASSLLGIVFSCVGIAKNKDYSFVVLGLALINFFAIMVIIANMESLDATCEELSCQLSFLFAPYAVIVLLFSYMCLSIIQLILRIDFKREKDTTKNDKFSELYKYKKLLDDELITKEEFLKYRKQILENSHNRQ